MHVFGDQAGTAIWAGSCRVPLPASSGRGTALEGTDHDLSDHPAAWLGGLTLLGLPRWAPSAADESLCKRILTEQAGAIFKSRRKV